MLTSTLVERHVAGGRLGYGQRVGIKMTKKQA